MIHSRLATAAALAIGLLHVVPLRSQTPSAFEVASVRASDPKGVPPDSLDPAFAACNSGPVQLDGGRLTATGATLYTLATLAYGVTYSCFIVNDQGLLTGGPSWVLTDRFDIQATFPPGTPSRTTQELFSGSAPEIAAMLRTLLADRFKLSVRHTTKETRIYELTLAPGGAKLPPPDPDNPPAAGIRLEPNESQEILVHVLANKATVADFTHTLEPVTHTPVLDHTGLAGQYRFDAKFAVIEPFSGPLANLVGATSPSIYKVLQEQLGLKLTQGRGSVDAWVIEHAEKPSGN